MKNRVYKVLRGSEKYTGTDMVYLARGGFWLTGGQIISSVATFGLAIAFANLLPKEIYGTYKFVLSVVGILSIFTLPGMMTAATQAVARGFEGSASMGLRVRLRWGVLGGLAGLGTALYYFLNGNTALTFSFLIVALFLPFLDTLGIYESLLKGKKRFRELSIYNVWQKVVSVIVLVIAIVLTDSLFIVLLAYFVPYTLLRYILLRHSFAKFQTNKKSDGSIVSYGKHLSLMTVITTVATNLDTIILFHFLGAPVVAIYSFALAAPQQVRGVFKNIGTLALPKFANRTLSEIKATITKRLIRYGLVILAITAVYIVVAPYLYRIFFPQYLDAVLYSQIISLSLIAMLNGPIIAILESHKHTGQLYIFYTIFPAIRILLLVGLTIPYGLMGAVLALVIGRIGGLVLSSVLLATSKDVGLKSRPI